MSVEEFRAMAERARCAKRPFASTNHTPGPARLSMCSSVMYAWKPPGLICCVPREAPGGDQARQGDARGRVSRAFFGDVATLCFLCRVEAGVVRVRACCARRVCAAVGLCGGVVPRVWGAAGRVWPARLDVYRAALPNSAARAASTAARASSSVSCVPSDRTMPSTRMRAAHGLA